MNDKIYALCEIDGDPFYVGRTIDWHNRWKNHIYAAQTGTEAKYQHIRKLWAAGKDFEMVILDDNPGLRYEKYYHWLLGVEYDLTNQKMGDAWATETEIGREFREKGMKFNGPKEFLNELDRKIAEAKARKEAEKTQAKIRSETQGLQCSDTTRFATDYGQPSISGGLQEMINRRKK